MTWEESFSLWLIDNGRRAATVRAYLQDVHVYARWFERVNEEPFAPALLNAPDVREYRRYSLEEERVSASTWNRRRASLAVFAAWALEAGEIRVSPMRGVARQKERRLAVYWLDNAAFRRVRRQMEIDVNTARSNAKRVQALRDRAMVSLMLYAGLRVSEVVALDVDDVTLRERSGEVRIRDGKGGVSARLPLALEARLAIAAWLEVRPRGATAMFVSAKGARITRRQVERRVAALGDKAGVDELHPHRLRHTFIRRLAVDGNGREQYPPSWVQALARHTRSSTTARYFAPSHADFRRMVETL